MQTVRILGLMILQINGGIPKILKAMVVFRVVLLGKQQLLLLLLLSGQFIAKV